MKKQTKKIRDYHARLVIYGIPDMDKRTYQKLIAWLETTAKNFKKENDRKIYAKTFIGRLMK